MNDIDLENLKNELIQEITIKKMIEDGDLILQEVKEDGIKRFKFNDIKLITKKD